MCKSRLEIIKSKRRVQECVDPLLNVNAFTGCRGMIPRVGSITRYIGTHRQMHMDSLARKMQVHVNDASL